MTAGSTFFDNDAIFATYTQNRQQRLDNPNDTLEKPVMLELIGTVGAKAILDLGCGDAAISRELLQQGATPYLGIDSSANMVALASQTLVVTAGRAIQHTIEDWRYPEAAFDLVLSRLALHYVADFPALCAKIIDSLRPSGQFVFSVNHPVITSCDRGWDRTGPRQDWLVDNYFDTGLRVTEWLGRQLEKYHRTIEDYFNALQHIGFIVEHLRESSPQRACFQDEQTYRRRQRIPLFLFLSGRKPS